MISPLLLYLSLALIAGVFPHAKGNLSLPFEATTVQNLTTAPFSHNTSGDVVSSGVTIQNPYEISCYIPTEGRPPPVVTTFHDCVIIFAQISSLPRFSRMQEFLEGVRPRLSHEHFRFDTPPYLFANTNPTGGNCAIFLSAAVPEESDDFSWEQVVHAAQAILRECGSPGYGGRSSIGLYHSWLVRLYGYVPGALSAE